MSLDDASYLPLADYGLIGDCRTAALVSSDGSIDWLCAPDFDHEGLVYRYRGVDDGLPGSEATFAACSFWLVENLAAMGERDEARRLFESLLERATPLGLFAEELDPAGGQRGNIPQALTLLALVNAALALDGRSALGRR